MTFDQLKTFYIVAKSGSFTNAASELNMDQSNVSRKIIAMEIRLKAKLFVRKSRGLILTPEGQILLEEAKDILERMEGMKNLLTNVNKEASGHLNIYTYVGFYDFFVRPYLDQFREAFPDITLKICKNDLDIINFDSSEMTIAITPYLNREEDIIQESIMRTHIKLYASPEYLEKFGTPENPEDLNHHKLIAYGPKNSVFSTMNWHLTLGASSGKPRQPVVEVNCPETRVLLAERGAGIASIPVEFMDLSKKNLVQVLPQEEGTVIDFFYSYPTIHKRAVPVMRFLGFLRAIFAK